MKRLLKALLLGALLLLLVTDFAMYAQESEADAQESEADAQESEADAQEPKPLNHVFYTPLYQGYRLDVCLVWANYCGSYAAHVFCLSKGYSTVYSYATASNAGPTKLIGTNEVCNYPQCGSFSYIVCQ